MRITNFIEAIKDGMRYPKIPKPRHRLVWRAWLTHVSVMCCHLFQVLDTVKLLIWQNNMASVSRTLRLIITWCVRCSDCYDFFALPMYITFPLSDGSLISPFISVPTWCRYSVHSCAMSVFCCLQTVCTILVVPTFMSNISLPTRFRCGFQFFFV